uniref:Uncharacterized protein n=1 Tax=Ditylenchus dipsaci TaxID=166011 RepID=A0A915D882_9BILA
MKGILLLFHGSWKLAENNQRRLDRVKMFSILLSIILSVQQCGGDARVLERYERQLNNLQNKMNKGRPMIVNGKLKRFRCIEEYVLVDDMGNPIESSSIQPGSSLAHRPAVQAQQQFYTKKAASLFSTPSTLSPLPTTSIWTTTPLPRQQDPIVSSPSPFTHISSSSPSLMPKQTMGTAKHTTLVH